jgi:hypothetical protein
MAVLREKGIKIPVLRGILPIKGAQVPADIIAGITLVALKCSAIQRYRVHH